MSKIVLKGFYGFGNLGDDILMITTYNLAREIFPDYEILISSDSNNSKYIERLLNNSCRIISGREPIDAVWIIHGGGGVFFDFKEGDWRFLWLNRAIRVIGYNLFRKCFNWYSKFKGSAGTKFKYRAGLGIGIGTYKRSSARFRSDILALSTFNFLLVRDSESKEHIQEFGFKYPTHCGSDLAFLTQHWNDHRVKRVEGEKNIIGFILRDWFVDGSKYLRVIRDVAVQLKESGRELKFFSFDRNGDRQFIERFSRDFSVIVWDPFQMRLQDYLLELSQCSFVVTSRAHGAIVSACLGIPAICLGIEPKLHRVFDMLSNSAIFVQAIDRDRVVDSIKQAEMKVSFMQENTMSDSKLNERKVVEGIDLFKEFIRNPRNHK